MPTQFRFIDLCAGIGGMRIPFDQAKGGLAGVCVYTAEINDAARWTYSQNFRKPKQTPEQVNEEINNDLLKLKPKEIPDHDLLLAGFPCQPFSHAGKRKGFEDDRGNIFNRIIAVIAAKKPKIILLENVRGLLTLRNDDNSKAIVEVLSKLRNPERTKNGVKYIVPKPKLLNARDFGLAQNRNRVFIIALRQDVAELHGVTEDNFEWPMPTHDRNELKVGAFLENRVPPSFTISNRLWEGHQRRKERNVARGTGWGYQLFNSKSKYVATISARYWKDGSEVLIEQRGRNPRKLTPKEGAALQGFPKDFILHGSKMEAFKQIGNAVPVNVVRALAKSLQRFL